VSIKILLPIPFTNKTTTLTLRSTLPSLKTILKAALPVRASDSRYWPNTPIPFGNASNTYRNTAEQLKAYQGWVSDCVSLIAQRIASIPLRLYDNKDELIEEHPFYDLMKRPNPDTTAFLGKELRSTYKDLTGECYIFMAKDGLGIPRELYFRSPERISPVVKNGIVDHFKYLQGYQEIIYPREDILYWKYANPTDPFRGASPVQRKAYAYDTDKYNMIYQLNTFKNGAHLKSVLETDKNLDETQVKRMLKIFNDTYGGIENTGKTGAAVGGLKFKTIGLSNKDMEYMLLAKWTMQQIASAYHTPPQKLSHPEQTNLANMKALDVSWNRECILPRLIQDAEVFNAFLLPLYKQPGLYCKYDNPVPEDEAFLLKKRESNLKNFVISVNEARKDDGMDDAEWGEKPIAPFSVAPLEVNKPKEEPEPEPEKAFQLKEYTEEYKNKYWDIFIKRITPIENKFKRSMIKYFQEQELTALRALRAKKSISIYHKKVEIKSVDDVLKVTHSEKELNELARVAIPLITESVKINGIAAFAELGVGVAFDVTNPAVIKWIKERGGLLIKSISDTTLDKLIKTLAAGVDAGESIPLLAGRISDVFADAKGYRSTLIARTETISASNSGALQAYKQSGVVKKKEWLATMDDRVRDEHAVMNGEIVGIDEAFSNGEMSPGEPNCRCTILPVIEKD